MGTNRTFQDMLNDHLNYDLLKEELLKRDYILSKVDRDDDWLGGPLVVPFKAAGASSVSFGGLTASNDIGEDKPVRGEITVQPEVWGSLLFNHRDLMEHNKVSEQNFLKILPDAIDDFMDYIKMVVCLNITNGAHIAKLTADGDASGHITVDRPERLVIGQKVGLKSDTVALAYYYVTGMVMDSGVITVSTVRNGSAADVSAYTSAANTKCYVDGAFANSMTSLKSSLLSAANGGSTTLYGQTKTLYPYLQSINVLGSSVSATNLLEKIFDAFTVIRNRGKGNPLNVLMSFKHLGTAMKLIEASKGAFNVVPGSTKVTQYGWNEIMVMGVKGTLTLVGIQEIDDDWIGFIDWRALKFHSNGFFRKRVGPDGKEYFEVRATTGYYYISDVACCGDLVLNRPSYCGILHSISY
jgi:hypothetical protein